MKIEALFISDIHLGSKGSNADKVLELLKVGKKALANYLDLYHKDISLIGSIKDECDFIKEEGEEIGSWYSYATEDNIKTGTPLAYLVISDVHLCDEESDDEDD